MREQARQRALIMLSALLDSGQTYREVGRDFGIGHSTVERHVKALLSLVAFSTPIAGVPQVDMASLGQLRMHAREVMAAVRNFEPDAIILDISMPGESGYQLAKQVRAWFYTYRPLLIAIRGVYRKPTDALLSQAVGFDHHLTKPCNIDELLALLEPRTRTRR